MLEQNIILIIIHLLQPVSVKFRHEQSTVFIYCIYYSPLLVCFDTRGISDAIEVCNEESDNEILQEYDESDNEIVQEYDDIVEILENDSEPEQRTIQGRLFTGSTCEYIKLGSITANDGCTDGEEKDDIPYDNHH